MKSFLDFFKYAIVGGIATVTDFVLFIIFYELLSINYIISLIISFILSTLVNWVAGRLIVFTGEYNISKKKEGVYIYIISIIALVIHLLVTTCTVEIFNLSPIIGKVLSVLVAMFWSFFARKVFIYK